MAVASIKLEGAKELERKLTSLERKIGKKIVRTAVRNAWKILLAAAKGNAQGAVGGRMGTLLARSLVLRTPRRQKRGGYAILVRMKSASEGAPTEFWHTSAEGKTTYVPAAVEYGHGRNKEQAARPFMRNAFDRVRQQVLSKFIADLRQGIERIARTGH
jgi:HK97 gp10 family phage protein